MLTILIPFKNEKDNLYHTIKKIRSKIHDIENEIILINDYSSDNSLNEVLKISRYEPNIILLNNKKKGLGGAIQLGIKKSRGDYVTIMMADASDDIKDLRKYFKKIYNENLDAVFGTRFSKYSKVTNYPKKKLILNRLFNNTVKLFFLNNYNDFTNAFKIYKKDTLKKLLPINSKSFDVFLELPLKIIVNDYNYKIISINWLGRSIGKSKFVINELMFGYFFIFIKLWIQYIKKKIKYIYTFNKY